MKKSRLSINTSNNSKEIKKYMNKTSLLLIFILFIFSYLSSVYVINNKVDLGCLKNFNIWLMLLFVFIYGFIFGHFIFPIKKYYNFIFKKRYLICFFVLILLVLGKFNGSSIGIWNNYIDPNEDFSSDTIIGVNRGIRSDEWLVNTPYAFSQQYNDYKYFSNLPRGTKTDMFSTIFVPVKDILILARPFNIGYLLLGEEYGLSFYWYGRLIALFLVTIEMLMLITNKKKIPSVVGAFMIAGSSAVQWWYSNYIIDLLISGQLYLIIFNALLNEKSKKRRVFYSIIIGLSFSWFALTLYPAWQVPLGYMYLLMLIWVIAKNYKNNNKLSDYSYLLISFVIVIIFILRYLMLGMDTIKTVMSTVYPGKRFSLGGNASIKDFIYPISIFFPFIDYQNPCEASGIYSLFPIPIIIAIVYLIKNRKSDDNENKEKLLLTMLTILCVMLSLYTMIKFPKIVVKATLLSMSPAKRVFPIVGIICTYILAIMTDKIKIEKRLSKLIALVATIIVSIIIVYIGNLYKPGYLTLNKLAQATVLLIILIYTFITSYNKKSRIVFSILMISICTSNILFVNPINVGTRVAHDKSTAKEIRKIVKNDKNGIWIGIDSITLPNYVLMNGGKIINSTNIYPNLKLWKKIDKGEKYSKVYNRYARIVISLVDTKTTFKLNQNDVFKLNLNYNDIDKLGIKYIIYNNKISEHKSMFKEIYQKGNVWIYEFTG